MTRSSGRQFLCQIGVVSLLLVAVGWALGRRASGFELLQARLVQPGAFGSGDLAEILQLLGGLHPMARVPGDQTPGVPGGNRRGWQPGAYSLDPVPRKQLAEAYMVEEHALALGQPVVSLIIPERDLAQLDANSLERGRKWERAGWLAYLDEQRLEFASGVGVRVHGGGRREKAAFRSWRIYFRSSYGYDHFVPEIFPGRGSQPPRQLVIRVDSGPDKHRHRWHFANPLAMDIARRVGIPAPETKLAIFYLNGELQGAYALTEYIQRDFLTAHFGHDDFVLVRTKRSQNAPADWVKEGDPERYDRLRRWVRKPRRLTVSKVAEHVDLDNLTRWILAVSFCATGDLFQGSLVIDQSDPDGRWFWIAWDMDMSFGLTRPGPDRWRRDLFSERLLRRDNDIRSILFRRLVHDDPEYRRLFLDTFDEVMNHRLTPEFLAERSTHYDDLAQSFNVRDRKFLDEVGQFINKRPGFLIAQLKHHLGAGERFRVKVKAGRRKLRIDGHPTMTPWSGSYFEGGEIELRPEDEEATGFSHWLIDGSKRVEGPVLRQAVTSSFTVRAVFERPGAAETD